jgi:hypothetical protein
MATFSDQWVNWPLTLANDRSSLSCVYFRTYVRTANLSNPPQLGMSVLWWMRGLTVGRLTRFTLSTCF